MTKGRTLCVNTHLLEWWSLPWLMCRDPTKEKRAVTSCGTPGSITGTTLSRHQLDAPLGGDRAREDDSEPRLRKAWFCSPRLPISYGCLSH